MSRELHSYGVQIACSGVFIEWLYKCVSEIKEKNGFGGGQAWHCGTPLPSFLSPSFVKQINPPALPCVYLAAPASLQACCRSSSRSNAASAVLSRGAFPSKRCLNNSSTSWAAAGSRVAPVPLPPPGWTRCGRRALGLSSSRWARGAQPCPAASGEAAMEGSSATRCVSAAHHAQQGPKAGAPRASRGGSWSPSLPAEHGALLFSRGNNAGQTGSNYAGIAI